MVLNYYNLREQPFGVTPDSRFLFLSPTHREALASLLYGVDAGCGFLALIAPQGLGKTTVLFRALDQLRENARTIFLFQTVCTSMDLLRALLAGLGVRETRSNLVQLQLLLKETLMEQFHLGKRVVLVIDEAQNLDDSVLELVRMLSNFETPREKLIQIILCGQPQLAEKIASPELEQLRQRISIFARLKPFTREDTGLYIDHRLRTAGYRLETPLFTRDALALIADCSEGIPRNINNLCFNSLLLGCALQRKPIDSDIVREVVADLDLDRFQKKDSAAASLSAKASRKMPAFLSAAGTPSMFAGWSPKLAISLAVLLALSGALFAGRRGLERKTAVVRAESLVRPQGTAAPPPDRTEPAAPMAASSRAAAPIESTLPQLVALAPPSSLIGPVERQAGATTTTTVTPGETLLQICVASFGTCDVDHLQQIRKLNPRLSNLDHIETGQKILLPAAGVALEDQGAALSARDGRP